MTEIFSQPDDAGPARASEAETSMWGRLGAQAADTLDPKDSLSGMWFARRAREANAAGTDQAVGAAGDLDVYSSEPLEQRQAVLDAQRAAIPEISQGDAKLLLKQEGLTEQDVHLGDQETHKLPVLRMRIDEAHTRRDRQAAIERGPQGFFPGALGLVTSLGVGMIDPVNAAAFSIPVIGEARMGKIIASAGDSILARGAARFGQGAAQGAAGTAVLQPADWWLHTRDGQDYTMAQAMESIIMGAGMGGAFHAIPGGVGDVLARRRGLPLAGSPQDLLLRGLMTGTHVHADQLAEEGVPVEEVPGIAPVAAPGAPEVLSGHPADALADLPPAAREDAVHAAMADIIAGKPTQAAEMLNIAADHDPRIAESLEAWHGSPHDFDRFDLSKVGTGEGAQSYGHGLYFAENRGVAEGYRSKLADGTVIPNDLLAEYFKPGEIINSYGGRDKVVAFDKETGNVTVRSVDANGEPTSDLLGLRDRVHHTMLDLKELNAAFRRRGLPEYKPGALYKVRINADPEHFLDWDKPVSEQSEHVRNAIEKHPDQTISGTASKLGHDVRAMYGRIGQRLNERLSEEYAKARADLDVAEAALQKPLPPQSAFRAAGKARERMIDLERQMNSHETASKALSEAGIPGIKYLDQGSRGAMLPEDARKALDAARRELAADPENQQLQIMVKQLEKHAAQPEATRNFVVFDDKHIEITHKNGEPVRREDLVAEHQMQQAKSKGLRGRAAADPRTWSLFEYLASKGGLKPDPELRAILGNDRGPFVPGFGPLIRKSGATLDQALTHAKEGGYLIDPNDLQHVAHTDLTAAQMGQEATLTLRDLLDRIDNENRGQKQYRPDHIEATKYDAEQEKHVIMGALEHELETHGASVADIDPQLLDRAVEIVHREGVSDVMEAYERAIIEDEERYNATADAFRTDPETRNIPGWDAASDASRAFGDRGRHSENGREAGRSDDGARRADGQEPARAGQSGRSSPAVVAADPRWRQLADATPDYNDPETLAESEAADRVPEPDSLVPERSLTALETAAADAEEVWRKLEPTLTEKERALVHDVMNQLKLDAETRAKIITDGAACLVGAVG